MSADLKRVRANQDEGYTSPASKRRLTGSSAMASTSGTTAQAEDDSGIEDWMKVVETHRKEAIFRQMLEYRRSAEREYRKAREVEDQRRRLQASVQSYEVCWNQVVEAIRTLVGQDAESSTAASIEPVIDPQLSLPALEQALQTRLPATKKMISRLVETARKGGSRSPNAEDLQDRCIRFQAEASTSRSANQVLRSELSSAAESAEKYKSDLVRAEKRLDKQRMDFDKAEGARRNSSDPDQDQESTGTPGRKPAMNGPTSGHATPNGKHEGDVKPNLDKAAGLLQDTTELEHIADSRLKELLALRSSQTALQIEVDKMRQLARHPSEEALRSAPFFQLYLHQISQHHSRAEALQQKFDAAESQLDKLRQNNSTFQQHVLTEGKAEAESLRSQVQKLNSDSARLRGQRDEAHSELLERKLREDNRFQWGEEMEALAKSREGRIGTLISEVTRLKGAIGAGSGSAGYLSFLRTEGADADYVRSLESKVADAQSQVKALSTADSSSAELTIALNEAQRALSEYQRVFGPEASANGDVAALSALLQAADKEKSTLLLRLEQAEASTNSLYKEVETLADMINTLQTQLNTKAYDVKDVDARLARLATEKAKADNRYFQAMRSKEALEGECRVAQRTIEKQLKWLEKASEADKGSQAQIAASEKSIVAVKNEAASLQNQLATVSAEKSQFEIRYQQSQAALSEAQTIMQQRVNEAAAEKEARIRLQEEVDKSATANKKLKERQEHLLANSGGDVSAGELQMKEERDKLLKILRCSCCEQNFKQQVIVKCMHTFCKQCLDARIASRQRKCPACGLSFAKEDVQTLYWQ